LHGVKDFGCNPCLHGGTFLFMDVREMARLGGLARAESMSAEQRRKSATKASKAAAAARKRKAQLKKKKSVK